MCALFLMCFFLLFRDTLFFLIIYMYRLTLLILHHSVLVSHVFFFSSCLFDSCFASSCSFSHIPSVSKIWFFSALRVWLRDIRNVLYYCFKLNAQLSEIGFFLLNMSLAYIFQYGKDLKKKDIMLNAHIRCSFSLLTFVHFVFFSFHGGFVL